MYQPEMIAVSTTCMAEVIGDDLNAFIANAKKDGRVPMDFPPVRPYPELRRQPYHRLGQYDGRHPALLHPEHDGGKTVGSNGKLNIVAGFETYLGNLRVIKRMLKEMDVDYTFLSDPEEVLDTPTDGEFRMYAGGTTQDELRMHPTPSIRCYCNRGSCRRPRNILKTPGSNPSARFVSPWDWSWTDDFLMKVSELTGKPIPESLALERGRLLDMMTDSHTWLHGKRFSVYGDPDFVTGMCQFLLELGAEPLHVLCHNANKRWTKDITKLLKDSPYGQEAEVYVGKDLWHLRSLVFSNKPDFLIGNSYGKFIQRDTLHKGKEHEVPLIRIGFPLFDRHHLHRDTTLGYEGAMHMLKTLVNAVMEKLDQDTMTLGETDYAFDLIR